MDKNNLVNQENALGKVLWSDVVQGKHTENVPAGLDNKFGVFA